MLDNYITEIYPLMRARSSFMAGSMVKAQAVAMVSSDREFIAACVLAGRDARKEAESMVARWRGDLVKRIQRIKQGEY